MTPLPKWYKPVAVVAFLWNLLGCAAYLSDAMISPDDLAKMTAAQQAMYNSRPAWGVAATAFAVWFGAAGSLGLFLRQRWALPVLVISLLGVIAQDVGIFALRGDTEVAASAWVLQGLVLVVAVLLALLARTARTRGWIA
ncbi:MAG: hypothetical protein H3C62_07065 [Gemmatimonadaceae bacterium]|nr:hypothetical protein [Gemmatimonadaceae bacterium]